MRKARLHQLSRFLTELSRRKVIRVVGVYIVTVWLLSQGVADLFPAFGLPDWTVRYFVLAGLLAIPIVALISWYLELTPLGLVRDEGDAALDKREAEDHQPSVLAQWIDRDGEEKSVRFTDSVLVGRHFDADIRFHDKRVSRRHARISPREDGWWIEDLGSSNGTFVDGEPVSSRRLDLDCELRFHREGPRVLLEVESLEDTAISLSRS